MWCRPALAQEIAAWLCSAECDVQESKRCSSGRDSGEREEEAPSGQLAVVVAQSVVGVVRPLVGQHPNEDSQDKAGEPHDDRRGAEGGRQES